MEIDSQGKGENACTSDKHNTTQREEIAPDQHRLKYQDMKKDIKDNWYRRKGMVFLGKLQESNSDEPNEIKYKYQEKKEAVKAKYMNQSAQQQGNQAGVTE